MSTIVDGVLIKNDLCKNAMSGTEMMTQRLLKYVDIELFQGKQIHISRPSKNIFVKEKKQILMCHDLAADPENFILKNGGWKQFNHYVFVSHFQRDQYVMMYGIPYSRCSVIQNAIELEYEYTKKQTDQIRFIYHTTPHRGLQLVYPIFDALSKEFDNIHLDVYSSFNIYGWEQRDEPYKELFEDIKKHEKMTYHGTQPNNVVLKALKESHVFLYPSIWMETSCIAMIEAIRSGCIVIHPNYGALPETSCGVTAIYDFSENPQTNANRCFAVAKNLLLAVQENDQILNNITASTHFELPLNDINRFKTSWERTLIEHFDE
jgi:glycosyltransferase involved in cell wall biosynthesis